MHNSPPLLDRISDYVGYWAARAPDRPVFLAEQGETTYAQLAHQVDEIARALIAGGVGRGDVVAMLATPRPIFLATLLAAASIGAVWVGINPRLTQREIAAIVSDARPRLILCQQSFEQTRYVPLMAEACAMAGHEGEVVVFHGAEADATAFESFLARGGGVTEVTLQEARAGVMAGDPAVLVYTSGSTGVPKGVMLSHHSLCFVYREQIAAFGIIGGRFVANLPINHIGGIGFVGCNPLIGGGSMYFMDRFDASAVLGLAQRGEIDCLLALSGMIQTLVDLPEFTPAAFARVRTIAWGGASLPPATVERLRQTGSRLATLYGMSEMPGSISVTRPSATLEELTQTVGRVSPYMDLCIVAADGSRCPPGQVGEIRVRHTALFLGYYNRPDETRASLDEQGYFRTGDIGSCDEEGNLRVVGRLKEMYKSGGYNIYPREIEACLEDHADVAGAAVVAVPDERFQEVGWAFVLSRSGGDAERLSAELAQWCAARLANFKRPKRIVVVPEFPRLPSGKTDKTRLREIACSAST